MIWIMSGVAAWVISGVLAYGAMFAHLQRSFRETADKWALRHRLFAVLIGACGPIGLLVAAIGSEFRRGFLFRVGSR